MQLWSVKTGSGKCQTEINLFWRTWWKTLLAFRKHFSVSQKKNQWNSAVVGRVFVACVDLLLFLLRWWMFFVTAQSRYYIFIPFFSGYLIFQKSEYARVFDGTLASRHSSSSLTGRENKRNRRKLVSVKFPAAARFDSPARRYTALGVVRLCDEWAFNRDDFCLLPRVPTYFSFVFILFIYFLPPGCRLSPTPPLVLHNIFHACGCSRHLSTLGDRFAVNLFLLLSDCLFLRGKRSAGEGRRGLC